VAASRSIQLIALPKATIRLDVSPPEMGGFRPPAGLLQVVSNVTGAYVEADSKTGVSLAIVLKLCD